MPKFKYTGADTHNLAQVGIVCPGDIFEVTDILACGLEYNAPELYIRQTEAEVPVAAAPKAKAKASPLPVE